MKVATNTLIACVFLAGHFECAFLEKFLYGTKEKLNLCLCKASNGFVDIHTYNLICSCCLGLSV